MKQKLDAISKNPLLKAAEDYYRLRREGIGFIEQMASNLWTDYNTHDPGITILEALCYAITDLAYRTSWDIQDILAPAPTATAPKQAFFTARDILTVNPVTPDDFRRLLIDLKEVRNAWVYGKQCGCDLTWYAWCDAQKQLTLGYQKPTDLPAETPIASLSARGLYEIWLELEEGVDTQPAIDAAKKLLQQHRNLCEDYCTIKIIDVQNVAVCADVEVTTDADIELIQAKIWLAIEQYFNPPVHFYTLAELMADAIPVEAIFNGPVLNNGFIKADELANATIKTVLRVSDLINLLMDIDGVLAINDLLLTGYDAQGQALSSTSKWLLNVTDNHQPRLYIQRSRFLFFKKGLPFTPRMDEVNDTLIQLRGETERPKTKNTVNDLPVPEGRFRDPQAYTLVQHSLPFAYGVSVYGLPANASVVRKAQAKQLKAYLMVFEQLLSNAYAQLTHTADLFSLDPSVQHSYFVNVLNDEVIKDLKLNKLAGMVETRTEFHHRRNRFLNHLMARFGEQFDEYALLLTDALGQLVALDRLIDDKIAFLNAYPLISHDRGKAFNYRTPYEINNISGIQKRVSLLLGYPALTFTWYITALSNQHYTVKFKLRDNYKKPWFSGKIALSSIAPETVQFQAWRKIITAMSKPSTYAIETDKKGRFRLRSAELKANHSLSFATEKQAQEFRDELISWSGNERAIVVEHLLLRPKFIGDALYPVCADGDCQTCEADPYSFRLTVVMPSWTPAYNTKLDKRQFAERTLLQELPAHLIGKLCWVGDDGFIDPPCNPVVSDITELLLAKDSTTIDKAACDSANACATAIYEKFNKVFYAWYNDDKVADYIQADNLAALPTLFDTIKASDIVACASMLEATLWTEINTLLKDYFNHLVLYGWQFERFEQAWYNWLEHTSDFNWTEQQLQSKLETIFSDNAHNALSKEQLCQQATTILQVYGTKFYQWINNNFNNHTLPDFNTFIAPSNLGLETANYKAGTEALIAAQLQNQYKTYPEVSYRLKIVIELLSKLRNTYPAATLHDCDDGNDENPVRLNNTALGNYRLS
jgi:hypothetical protein